MQFMMIVKATAESEAGRPPDPRVMARWAALTEESTRQGILVASGGLQPSANGARISLADGQRIVIDGPFSETKELVGGFAILEAGSKAEAIALAQRAVDIYADLGVAHFDIEIRPLLSPVHVCQAPS